MARKVWKYRYTPKRDAGSRQNGWDGLSDDDYHADLQSLKKAAEPGTAAPEWAEDLFRIARAVFLADKFSLRSQAPDNWTREIHLSVQVASVDRWEGAPRRLLEELLRVLTADDWHVAFHGGAPFIDAEPRFEMPHFSEVALFSGGLDSTAYAADLARRSSERVLLVAHKSPGAVDAQKCLYKAIQRLAGDPARIGLAPTRDRPAVKGRTVESTTRSRGLLFVATAIFVAAACGIQKVSMPENGQLAINPPIHPARLGACSTRSVHPWVLRHLNRLIQAIGGDITVRNPFLFRTKGEVCRLAADAGLSPDALARTMSCGRDPRVRNPERHCGFCYPCLIRRSGLLSALGHDPTTYRKGLRGLTKRRERMDLEDLRRWAARKFTARDLLADHPLPPDVPLREVVAVIERGRREIRKMLGRIASSGDAVVRY